MARGGIDAQWARKVGRGATQSVMPGLDPGIHAVPSERAKEPLEWIAGPAMTRGEEGEPDLPPHSAPKKSQSGLMFSAMTTNAVTAASAVTQRGEMSCPILRLSAVNITSGTMAKGSWRLNTT